VRSSVEKNGNVVLLTLLGHMGFRDSRKRPQAMSNGKTMALLESNQGHGNGAAMGVQCVCALPLPLHGNGKQSTTAI
jgi:hypothetical protein